MSLENHIEDALARLRPFTGLQAAPVMEKLTVRTLKKGEFLLAPPKVCSFAALVLRGSFRMFRNTGEKDNTLHFFTEGDWVGDMESFTVQKPTVNYIQAMEKAELATLTIHALHELIHRDPSFLALGRIMKEWSVPSAHYTSLINDSPDERYQTLLKAHPDWILRFPQMHLASYLGMSRETFSRVKRRNMVIC